jgi:putative transposase
MEREVETRTGAAHGSRDPDRLTHRNGDWAREWETREATAHLQISKIRKGSYFPGLLEPWRMSEKAVAVVIQEDYVQGSRSPSFHRPGSSRDSAGLRRRST